MKDLIEHMAEIELGRFSVNDYRGLPDAPAFSVVEGELPIVVSAPHAVSQLREGRVKPSDDFTGAKVLAFARRMKSSGAGAFSGIAFIPYFLFPDDVSNLHIQG